MRAGDRVLNYIVERELGEGGMGSVYLARHTVLNQQVAIKALSPLLSRDPAVRERFIQEANIQASLRHPGIVLVLNAGLEGEQPVLVMEYIQGDSLFEVLERRGALPLDDALKIMEQVLSAVGYAHRQGVIHRDLKPENIMVTAAGDVKVTDFGIAKLLGSARLTRTGTVMGSAYYMSPEQIMNPESVDTQSDIYSLGCVFYELFAGRPPFGEKHASGTDNDFRIKSAHVNEVVPALPTAVPNWLTQLVMNMLEKSTENRPSNCEVILDVLEEGRSKLEATQLIEENDESVWKKIDKENIKDPIKVLNSKQKIFKKREWIDNAILTISVLFIVWLIFLIQGKSPVVDFFSQVKNIFSEQQSNTPNITVATVGAEAKKIANETIALILKIEAGNPNKLPVCLKEQLHLCWANYIWENGDKYEGEWREYKPNGLGAMIYVSGYKYVGELREGRKDGLGIFTEPNGEEYVGEFKHGDRNGKGVLTYAHGEMYSGEFKNNEPHGRGIRYRSNGTVRESGIFEKDKLVKSEYVPPESAASRATRPTRPIPSAPAAPPQKNSVSVPASYSETNARPVYPAMSKRLKEQGTVILRVKVKSDGTAGHVEVKSSSGYPRLDQAAIDAVQTWRFNPATVDGKAIEEWYPAPIIFKLE